MQDNYTYPAVFDYSEEGLINISFPDFAGAFTCVEKEEDAVSEAQNVLALTIRDYEERGDIVPVPSVNCEIKSKEKLVFINIWMPYHRSQIKEVYTKKTLTIPEWLNMLAVQNNINFSAVLAEGLKKKLGIEE